jgi:hypothetical protein
MSEGKGTHHNVKRQAERGGRATVLFALIRGGYLDRDYNLTRKGKAASLIHAIS